MNKLEKWIQNHPAFARLILLILAGINAWSAFNIVARSPLLALVQGILCVLMTAGAVLIR